NSAGLQLAGSARPRRKPRIGVGMLLPNLSSRFRTIGTAQLALPQAGRSVSAGLAAADWAAWAACFVPAPPPEQRSQPGYSIAAIPAGLEARRNRPAAGCCSGQVRAVPAAPSPAFDRAASAP